MKIGTHGIFGIQCMLFSKQSGPTLDFAQMGHNLQSKMADIENFDLQCNLRLCAWEYIFVTLMFFS